MATKQYTLIVDRFDNKAGTTVYRFMGHDYGLARDDSMHFGVEHISVTLDPEGVGHPSFTVPVDCLREAS